MARRWVGGGSDVLGLDGEVQDGKTVRLMSGEHPTSGRLLGQPMAEGSVAGFDLTLNAPKSIGLAFAIGDRWTARRCATATTSRSTTRWPT